VKSNRKPSKSSGFNDTAHIAFNPMSNCYFSGIEILITPFMITLKSSFSLLIIMQYGLRICLYICKEDFQQPCECKKCKKSKRQGELALLGELLGFKKVANNESSDLLQEHVCPLPWSAV
jgi:hypothetical protein